MHKDDPTLLWLTANPKRAAAYVRCIHHTGAWEWRFDILCSQKHLLAYYGGLVLGGTINRLALLALVLFMVVVAYRWFQAPAQRATTLLKAAIVIAAIAGVLLGTLLSNLFLASTLMRGR
jgi:hypothetical protein